MKKSYILFIALLISVFNAWSQTIVSTTPETKKVILEEFTGTGCPNCPGGHTMAANLLAANPNVLFVIAYHPTNSSYTSGDPMANSFGNAFYSTPFISPTNRYMPSAMINRRIWSTERIQGTSSWTNDVNTIKIENSPVNVGVSSSYNSGTKILTVNIEVYFTAPVASAMTLYSIITEDGIIANQAGGTSNYVHNHVFREALPKPTPEQWGEAISSPTNQGTLKTYTYTFDNSTANYDMTKCEVVVFVRDAVNEEIISGNGAAVGSTSPISVESYSFSTENIRVYPNPLDHSSVLQIDLTENCEVAYEISDVAGRIVYQKNLGKLDAGMNFVNLPVDVIENGVYFINITSEKSRFSLKVIK